MARSTPKHSLPEVNEHRPTDPEGCASTVLESLPTVMWAIRCYMRRNRTGGLSVPQFRTMVLLERYPGAPLSLVAEQLGSTLPTASRMVSGLVRKGLVRRSDDSGDRRKLSLELTPAGRRTLAVAQRGTQLFVAERLAELEARERHEIGTALTRLQSLFEQCAKPKESSGEDMDGADAKARTRKSGNRGKISK